jgi:phospholipid/cholesterol/gamma-HCH transport system permease protein
MAFAGTILFRVRSWRRVARFAGVATGGVSSRPSTYQAAERASSRLRQIYYTRVAGPPRISAFLGDLLSLVIIEIVLTAARKYGLAQYSFELVLRVLVLEELPLLTALFVCPAFGSGDRRRDRIDDREGRDSGQRRGGGKPAA